MSTPSFQKTYIDSLPVFAYHKHMIKFVTMPIREFLREVGQSSFSSDVLEIIEGLKAVGMTLDMDNGPWIAGGCLEALASGTDIGRRDIDIFYSRSCDKHRAFFDTDNVLTANGYEFNNTFWETTLSENSETRKVLLNGKSFVIQRINKKQYSSAPTLLGDFDFTVCQMVTDGENIFTTQQTIEDLKTKTLRFPRLKQETNTLPRFVKYTMEYGYTPAPGELQRIHEIIKGREEKYSRGSNS